MGTVAWPRDKFNALIKKKADHKIFVDRGGMGTILADASAPVCLSCYFEECPLDNPGKTKLDREERNGCALILMINYGLSFQQAIQINQTINDQRLWIRQAQNLARAYALRNRETTPTAKT